MLKKVLFFLICIGALFSCKKNASLEGFEDEKWKNDRLGCNGIRNDLVPVVMEQKEKILGLSEAEVLKTLGRPDFQELSKRNQKFYFYYLLPGRQCENGLSGAKEQTLQIRLNSVGYANEVLINKF